MSKKINIFLQSSPLIRIRGNAGEISVPRGTRTGGLLSLLGIPPPQQPYLLVIVNRKKQSLSYKLQANDSVKLLMPIGGG